MEVIFSPYVRQAQDIYALRWGGRTPKTEYIGQIVYPNGVAPDHKVGENYAVVTLANGKKASFGALGHYDRIRRWVREEVKK